MLQSHHDTEIEEGPIADHVILNVLPILTTIGMTNTHQLNQPSSKHRHTAMIIISSTTPEHI